ncbi:helix-turn-helix transcriptional regulator [Roseofilum reptotaenium CS-1145]|uniref:HTH cro/C1-type domain-containing protein n=1 Tax=Roseofilum reptotaenium AO1-A TaxID=1925591 RepID=A0A1L9QW20_9CYAN|nr:helix-turn-helix transcriptional regulator [Roseofilum reptotaenium]MDB9518024.1 helix-turn-helix transcriptional regulator [Roseofilum reptotaenium CS-1145]OJJ26891.1 hypothetical protein BI308_04150 [Roseofilum reptotaenium AO1-A]
MSQKSERRKLLFAPPEWDDVYPLEKLRKKKKELTQKKLAKEIGVGESTYQRWVGRNVEPSLNSKQIRKLCEILGITFDEYCDLFKDYED